MSCYVGFRAHDLDGYIEIFLKKNGEHRVQILTMAPGHPEIAQLGSGADPDAEGWEDGNGHPICWSEGIPANEGWEEIPEARDLLALGPGWHGAEEMPEGVLDTLIEGAEDIGGWYETAEGGCIGCTYGMWGLEIRAEYRGGNPNITGIDIESADNLVRFLVIP